MRNAMRNGEGKLKDLMRAGAISALRAVVTGQNGQAAKRQVLERVGIAAQGMIQDEITSLTSPPNSPVTIAIKGSSKPLIDSGEMRQAVTYVVE